MRPKYLGDSYDLVKQSLMRWLSPLGRWSVHPMFTEAPTDDDLRSYQHLLGAEVVSSDVLTHDTDRRKYLGTAKRCENLFLDPDTGLRIRATRGVRAPEYLFCSELVELSEARPRAATIVFDQSVGRGSERLHVEGKLRELRHRGVFGFAYVSHACFLVVSQDEALLARAKRHVLDASRLPPVRILDLSA